MKEMINKNVGTIDQLINWRLSADDDDTANPRLRPKARSKLLAI